MQDENRAKSVNSGAGEREVVWLIRTRGSRSFATSPHCDDHCIDGGAVATDSERIILFGGKINTIYDCQRIKIIQNNTEKPA